VPSSSLLPDSPNLLFTNAGMNQFVPIFLGQRAPDVSKWAGAVPGSDTRAADTQKCIRAGGKHNDLEDVGLDTYHLTFFEMLGNWSFGDYFKKESLNWGWELLTKVWGIPAKRLFATVYSPDKSKGDPSDFDQEAYDIWAEIFRAEGLDPKIHIVYGNKKDNFWMMGDTGPCGPCSEIHFNLLPSDDEKPARDLVNAGSQRCIEIWNHVFIQFNANPDSTYSPLPAKHVDTGMGFDRIAGFHAGTKGFKEFSELPSAYNTDIFRLIFDRLEKMSGKKYCSTLPTAGSTGQSEQEKIDIAFRVIADHIRTLAFAIADGIQPDNTGRNYVLRRILRRGVRYGRTLGFNEPFFYKLVDVLVENMGKVFPEIRTHRNRVEEIIFLEEEAFNKTLDRGIDLFEKEAIRNAFIEAAKATGFQVLSVAVGKPTDSTGRPLGFPRSDHFQLKRAGSVAMEIPVNDVSSCAWKDLFATAGQIRGKDAFELYDTYGFPLDLTELMARERGLTVDVAGFNKLMEEQRARARGAQKKEVVKLADSAPSWDKTKFIGFDDLVSEGGRFMITNDQLFVETSPFYAEMGGQVGDTGYVETTGSHRVAILNTVKTPSGVHVLKLAKPEIFDAPSEAPFRYVVDAARRRTIERHHTVTHLLHWALHEVVSKDAVQKGSFVGPEKLTFDFSSAPLTTEQIADVEKLVNERILENATVSWTEVPYSEVKSRKDIMQFFGDKYGDKVRVVQVGGKPMALDGYSMELCGGTHTRATGEIGLFRIVAESATGAGIRRIEAVAGLEAYKQANEQLQLIKTLASKINTPVTELEKKIESLLAQQKDLEKQVKAAQQKQAAETARSLVAKAQTIGPNQAIIENLGTASGDYLQTVADSLKGQFKGVVVLASALDGAVSFVVTVNPDLTKQIQAGKIIQTIAPIVGGKGGGRPDNARGGGKEVGKLDEALAKAKSLLG